MKLKPKFFSQLFIILTLTVNLGYAQEGGPMALDKTPYSHQKTTGSFQKSEKDSLINWQENVLLHVDKSVVNEGDPVFFKAHIMTGPKRIRVSASEVLILELVDDNEEVVTTQYHKIESGTAKGALVMPKNLEKDGYILRAYTRWMQNYGKSHFFTKRLYNGEVEKKDDSSRNANISFHPEGGRLINGLSNRLVIKALDAKGRPANLRGKIINEKGNFSAPISQYAEGFFTALLKPKSGESYLLKTSEGSSINLPRTFDDGLLLGVNNLNSSKLTLRIATTDPSKGRELFLKGEMSGVVYFKEKITLNELPIIRDVLKDGIPSGILRISLFDNDREWASRLVRIEGKNRLDIKVIPLSSHQTANEIAFKVSVRDADGNPVSTELSLGASAFDGTSESDGLAEWEETKWQIQSASFTRNERFLNDLRLLSSSEGSSKFGSKDFPGDIKFSFQKGLELYGHAHDLNNNLLMNTKIQVIAGSEDDFVVKEVNTDANGLLRLVDLQFIGETQFIFRTSGDDSRSRLVKFSPIDHSIEIVSETIGKDNNRPKKKESVEPSNWQPIDSTGLIELEEIKVKDKRTRKKSMNSVYGIEPSWAVYQDQEKPRTLPQLFLNIPGVQVTGIGGLYPRLKIPKAAGRGPILWVLDGLPMIQPTSLLDIMNTISSADVERIEILFGPPAAVYGTRAAGGAILIYTRTGNSDYILRKEAQLIFQGFHESPDFDSYREKLAKRNKKRQKEEKTLFWNPNLKTDGNGEAIVRFKSSIDVEKIEIQVSTVTEDGKLGRVRTIF